MQNEKDKTDQKSRNKRRHILKGIGTASTGVLIGVSGSGSASTNEITIEDRDELVNTYNNEEAVKRVLDEYAGEVLKEFSDRDIISAAESDTLNLKESVDNSENHELVPESEKVGFGVGTINTDEGLVTHIMISQSNENYNYGVYIQPEWERAYGIIAPQNPEEREELGRKYLINPSSSSNPDRLSDDDDLHPECSTGVLCSEDEYCGSRCDKTCTCLSSSWTEERIIESTYVSDQTGECNCYVYETVGCGEEGIGCFCAETAPCRCDCGSGDSFCC